MDKDKLPSLEALDKSIKKAKEKALGKGEEKSVSGAALSAKVSTELIAGVAVGTFIGYYLDKWLGTSPIFFIICCCFGIAGGMLNIYRMFMQKDPVEEEKDN